MAESSTTWADRLMRIRNVLRIGNRTRSRQYYSRVCRLELATPRLSGDESETVRQLFARLYLSVNLRGESELRLMPQVQYEWKDHLMIQFGYGVLFQPEATTPDAAFRLIRSF